MSDAGTVAGVASSAPAAPGNRFAFFARYMLLPASVGAVIACAILFVPMAGWTTNDVTTGSSPSYPDLRARDYDAAPTTAVQVAAASASTLSGWKVLRTDVASGVVIAEVRSPLPVFVDDLTVTVVAAGPGGTCSQVTIRSHSRVGIGDLGANAAHIRALQTVMDDKLPRLQQ